jgi:hypothetical protein
MAGGLTHCKAAGVTEADLWCNDETMGYSPKPGIPLFVVGYSGWSNLETLQSHLVEHPEVAGILIVDTGLFAAGKEFGNPHATEPWALWGLIGLIHGITNGIQAASTRPFNYAL